MNGGLVAAIVQLRLRRVIADRANLIWLLLMPLIFSYLMGQLMGNWSATAQKPTFIVYGLEHGGEALSAMLAPLDDHADFDLVRRDTLASEAKARRLLERKRVSAVLLVDTGYADSVAVGAVPRLDFFHDSDRTSSQKIRRAFDAVYARAMVRASASSLVDPDLAALEPGRAANFDADIYEHLLEEPRVHLVSESLGCRRYDDLLLTDSRQHSGPAYTLMFILMFLLMSAKDLVTERRQRTLDRLRIALPSMFDLLAGFFLAGVVVGLFQAVMLLGLNSLLFGIDYGSSPAALVVMIVLFVSVSSAAGLLLGTLAASGGQADGLGMVLGMGLPALGGLWWPLEITPPYMQDLGRALPTGQAITVFHDLIGRGWGVAETAPMLWGLAGWLVILLGLASFFFMRSGRA